MQYMKVLKKDGFREFDHGGQSRRMPNFVCGRFLAPSGIKTAVVLDQKRFYLRGASTLDLHICHVLACLRNHS